MDPLSQATFILAFATVILALATVALAYFTFKTVGHTKKQTDSLFTQTMILRSQIDPIPHITDLSFSGNELNLTVENLGSGPASSIAVETSFTPAKRIFYKNADSKNSLTKKEVEEILQNKKQVTIRYEIDEKQLEQNGEKLNPIGYVYILPNKEKNTLFLLSHETHSYNIKLGFGFKNEKKGSEWYPLYEDLVPFLKINNVTCFILGFRLLCKNMAEDNVPDQSIAAFIVDLTRHSNIEQAYLENTTPPMTIGLLELALQGIPINSHFYRESKSETYSHM